MKHYSQKYNFFLTLTCALSLVFGLSCKGDRPIQGSDLLINSDKVGEVAGLTTRTDFEASIVDTIASTGDSPLLALGQFDDLESRILLRFSQLPDTALISRATLVLSTNTLLAEGSSKSKFTAVLRKVRTAWDESRVTFETFHYDTTQCLSRAQIRSQTADLSAGDSSTVEATRFDFNETGLALVREWANPASADTHGLLIDFEQSDFVKEFFSRDNILGRPYLELQLSRNGSVIDTVQSAVTADAFIAKRLSDLPEGPLHVDHLYSSQSIIRFPVTDIPRESTINRAFLILNVDHENTVVKNGGFSFQLRLLSGLDETAVLATLDSNQTTLNAPQGFVIPSSGEIRFNLRNTLQAFVTGDLASHGFMLMTASPGRDVSRIAFFSRRTNASLAPRLEVEFSEVPGNR